MGRVDKVEDKFTHAGRSNTSNVSPAPHSLPTYAEQ